MRASNTLYELLENSIKEYKDNIAYSMFGGEDVTYAEVGRRVAIVQQMLLDAGLNAGDKVAILSSNMPNWGVCYFAVVSAGMVAVPILPDFTEKELDMLIRHSEAKALFVSDKLFTKLSKETVAMLDIVIRTKNLGVISQRTTGKGVRRVPQPDDLAVIIYTSGTMSRPKGVMLTHYNLASNVNMMYGLFPIDEHDSMLSVLPLSHTYECTVGMLYPFAAGGRVTYLEKPPTASILLPALRAVRPTCFLIVPLIIEKIYRSQIYAKFTSNAFWRKVYGNDFLRRQIHRLAGRRLMKVFGGRLRFLGIGGAKLNTQVEQFLVESRIPYAIGYGLTETAPMVAGAVPAMPRKVGSTGRAMEGLQVRLDNVNPETRQGEIVINSPSMMKGYYKNEAATAEAFTSDGWFRTGDLGCIDEDGVIYIKGRLKNMIVGPSGENIYPEEIESVLIVSPTYDGIVSDVEEIARVVHRHGKPLIVDEAHGAHFPFCDQFPKSALELGADVVVQSLHKTLPCFTQTAVLHIKGDRVKAEEIERYLRIYQSSSPLLRTGLLLQASENICFSLLNSVKRYYRY